MRGSPSTMILYGLQNKHMIVKYKDAFSVALCSYRDTIYYTRTKL